MRRAAGFTLVEMVLTAGLIGMLAATATWFWVDVSTLSRTVNNDNAAITEARSALERMAHEIREVKYNQTSGLYCVDTGSGNMSSTKLVFNKHHTTGSAVNGQCGGTNPTNSTNDIALTIQHSGSTVSLGYAGALASPATSQALLTSVSAFSIRYLNSGGTALANSTELGTLRFVEISLTVSPADAPTTSMKTLIALRNN